MRSKFIVAAVLCTLGAAGLAAADFWTTKAYTEWSQKEVEQMLTDSPWARRVSVVIPIPPRVSGDAGGRGGRGGDDTGGRGFPVPAPQIRMVVTWRSALPVRQALIRLPNGATNAAADQNPLLEQPPSYIITVSGVPARFSRATETAGETSFLRRGKKPPIALAQGGMQQAGQLLTLIFAFPRTDPITLDDKDVEFVTKIGTVEIKKKFALKDLVFNGVLEL